MQRKKQGKGVAVGTLAEPGREPSAESVPVSLSPSLHARVARMAQEHGRTVEGELHEVVHTSWVRFATEHRLKEW